VDHAGCVDTHKSTSRGIQFLGDKLVIWMSKKQDCTAMSLAEAEYVALSVICAQVLDELMKITGSIELHKRMWFWFVQEIAKEEGLLKFLCDSGDDLRRKNARHRVLIREMEALENVGWLLILWSL
nr:Gag-Pol polyprotein [Tanacetum cinerariifolium]